MVYALATSGTNLFAGTSDGVVWRRPLSEMITAVDNSLAESQPRSFQLEQNFPNPFNPSTTIRFSVPHPITVYLSVFNALGQEVQSLVNQQVAAGTYVIRWNPIGLTSGVYFYRLRAGAFTETRRMILLK